MITKHPYWLIEKAPDIAILDSMKSLLQSYGLHSICESAQCPNQGKCFARGTVTFLISGDVCTRDCKFCAVKKGTPFELDQREPGNLAVAISELNLKYVVITSVTRDDLPDGGAGHFVRVVNAIRQKTPSPIIEVLVPDFQGSMEAIWQVAVSSTQVINHNIETVPRLYPEVRNKAGYQRSLKLLEQVKKISSHIITKSGLMLGMGEERNEVIDVLADLRDADCDIVTLGQYLPPSLSHYKLRRYVPPQEFEELRTIGLDMGFKGIAAAPFVRSSYDAVRLFQEAKNKEPRPDQILL